MNEFEQEDEGEKPQLLPQIILVLVVVIMVMVFFLGM